MDTTNDYNVDHKIKSHPAPFSAVWNGEKMHEIRYNDRRYKVADVVRLLEYNPDTKIFQGRALDVIITNLRHAPEKGIDPYGLLPGFCVFDFLILNHFRKEDFPEESAGETFTTITKNPEV